MSRPSRIKSDLRHDNNDFFCILRNAIIFHQIIYILNISILTILSKSLRDVTIARDAEIAPPSG